MDPSLHPKSFVCSPCWSKVLDFHEYYEQVRQLHALRLDPSDLELNIKPEYDDGDEKQLDMRYSESEAGDEHMADESEGEPTPELPRKDGSVASSSEEEDEKTPHIVKRGRGRPRKEENTAKPICSPSQTALIYKYFSLNCTKCDEVQLFDLDDAKHHYKSVHQTDGYLMCCGKQFDKHKNIWEHCQFHEDISEHKYKIALINLLF